MTKEEAKSKLEFLETSEEEKAHGLRRIKRRHFTSPGEMALKDCLVDVPLTLDAEVLQFFESDSKKINAALRSAMKHEKIVRELLDDEEFISGIKEKLAA